MSKLHTVEGPKGIREYEGKESLSEYKHQASKAANDLCYGRGVAMKINNAKTIGEVERIMRTARKEKFG